MIVAGAGFERLLKNYFALHVDGSMLGPRTPVTNRHGHATIFLAVLEAA
jgi:hypothetical protein